MRKLLEGIRQFQTDVFRHKQPLFERLHKGQEPVAMFITCSDSRVVPNLLAQADPGDLFVLRNAGNLVPPYPTHTSGEAATIEYAVRVLRVPDIIVCGHSQCGAVNALLDRSSTESLPAVRRWLSHAERTLEIMESSYGDLTDPAERLSKAIEVNVLVQMLNVYSQPSVVAAVQRRELAVHAWVYHFEIGQVRAFNPDTETFEPLCFEEEPAST